TKADQYSDSVSDIDADQHGVGNANNHAHAHVHCRLANDHLDDDDRIACGNAIGTADWHGGTHADTPAYFVGNHDQDRHGDDYPVRVRHADVDPCADCLCDACPDLDHHADHHPNRGTATRASHVGQQHHSLRRDDQLDDQYPSHVSG